MKNTRVKICGNGNEDDIEAIEGADAAGFVVETPKSKRNVGLGRARELIHQLPPFVVSVAVTKVTDPEELERICALTEADVLQVHSELKNYKLERIVSRIPDGVKLLGLIGISAAPSREEKEDLLKRARRLREAPVRGVVLDTRTGAGESGGSGLSHDWEFSRKLRDSLSPVPAILAGGLGPRNVSRAIEKVDPYAVDIATGVEDDQGEKVREKVEAVFRQLRSNGGEER